MNETCISKLPRFQAIDRTQIFPRTTDVESLIAEDHPARSIWIFLSRLDLSKFSEEQRAVEGDVGRSAISPHLLFSEGLVGLERVTQDGTKIRAQASKRSFVDRKHLQQCLDLAKRHIAKVEADDVDQLSQQQEAARYHVQREREAKLQSALQSLSTIEQAKKHSEAKPAHVSISDPDARFMRQGDGAIAPSYNVQFTTDAAQGLVVGVAVSQAFNDAQELALAMDRFQQQCGLYPAQVIADGDFTNHQSVIAMHERGIEFFGSFGALPLDTPAARSPRTSRRRAPPRTDSPI